MTHSSHADLTVIIATHNRTAVLDRTLANLERVDRTGLAVEFVVVDNNSTDDTRVVVARHQTDLPLRYLFEANAGKNHALNRALDEVELGELVVFTDDDVNPEPGWLHAILDASRRHPDIAVFGGAIHVELPADAPEWAHSRFIQKAIYALHDLGANEVHYPKQGACPCGANLWLRASVLTTGHRFDGTMGPRPQQRFMGSETSLLRQLAAEGHEMLHVPSAVIYHCVQQDALTPAYVRSRAKRRGLSKAHSKGIVGQADLFARHPWLWRCMRSGSMVYWAARFVLAHLNFSQTRRIEGSIGPLVGMTLELQNLRLAGKSADEMQTLRKIVPERPFTNGPTSCA
jgi:GT2 family glycosyltransferase